MLNQLSMVLLNDMRPDSKYAWYVMHSGGKNKSKKKRTTELSCETILMLDNVSAERLAIDIVAVVSAVVCYAFSEITSVRLGRPRTPFPSNKCIVHKF